jgi:SAM-dependent methyltransferase
MAKTTKPRAKKTTAKTAKPAKGGKPRLLNVGGGSKAIAIPEYYGGFDHLLLDVDPKGKPDIVADARELAGLEAGQFDAIYCSHNLEHYFAHDVPKVLSGFVHVLKPGGFAEIRVPDIDAVLKAYVERGMDIEDVLYDSPAGPIRVRDVIYGFGPEIARSGTDFYAHKTAFTARSLAAAMTRAGFHLVYRRPGRLFELHVTGFCKKPTVAQRSLLALKPDP